MTAKGIPEDIIPVKVRVSDSWKRFILFCQNEVPFGDVSVKITNGEPQKLVHFKRAIRFDKPFSNWGMMPEDSVEEDSESS